jgi:hypothetical protein
MTVLPGKTVIAAVAADSKRGLLGVTLWRLRPGWPHFSRLARALLFVPLMVLLSGALAVVHPLPAAPGGCGPLQQDFTAALRPMVGHTPAGFRHGLEMAPAMTSSR